MRSRFQLTLITLLLEVFIASVWLGLNIRGGRFYDSLRETDGYAYYGWPTVSYVHTYMVFNREDRRNDIMDRKATEERTLVTTPISFNEPSFYIRGTLVNLGILACALAAGYWIGNRVRPTEPLKDADLNPKSET